MSPRTTITCTTPSYSLCSSARSWVLMCLRLVACPSWPTWVTATSTRKETTQRRWSIWPTSWAIYSKSILRLTASQLWATSATWCEIITSLHWATWRTRCSRRCAGGRTWSLTTWNQTNLTSSPPVPCSSAKAKTPAMSRRTSRHLSRWCNSFGIRMTILGTGWWAKLLNRSSSWCKCMTAQTYY